MNEQTNNTAATKQNIVAEENQMQRILANRLRRDAIKWADLLQMAGGNSILGAEWTGGNLNTAEELAAAAVAEAYELDDALDTEFNASVRRIAEYVQMPYARLLIFYTQHYILSNSRPQFCKYIPYKTLQQWRTTE